MKRTELVVFLAVMAVAISMRLCGLTSTPPGLLPAEAMNGNNALEASRTGEYKIFYPENSGRAGLFINLQAISVQALGNTTFALRLVAALAGVLTVLGVYLLTRRMFDDWRIAAIASFLMAVGFWHVNFSRIGISEVMGPLLAVWGFYYLYKGIETHRLWHWALAGVWFGLGFHTVVAFRIIPVAIACTLIALWLSLRAAFSHDKYLHARHRMLGGITMMVGVMIIVLLPMAAYFYANPTDLTGSFTPSVSSIVKTLGMFFFHGDTDWQHGISGEPVLFWPVAALFAVGLAHSLWRFGHSWRSRGHPGVVQSLLVSWFFIGLIPSFLVSVGSPDSLRALLVSPAVYILAAVGLHWLYGAMERWYASDDRSVFFGMNRGSFVTTFAVLSILFAVWVGDAHRYFVRWAGNPAVSEAFSHRSVAVAQRLAALPPSTLKYVVVPQGTVLVHGIPLSAQPVMFLTDTWLSQQQRARNIYYLTQKQFNEKSFPRDAFVMLLDPGP